MYIGTDVCTEHEYYQNRKAFNNRKRRTISHWMWGKLFHCNANCMPIIKTYTESSWKFFGKFKENIKSPHDDSAKYNSVSRTTVTIREEFVWWDVYNKIHKCYTRYLCLVRYTTYKNYWNCNSATDYILDATNTPKPATENVYNKASSFYKDT